MESHTFRPFLIFAVLVALVLTVRKFVVPKDFGVGPTGYMYGWHRKGNEADWKAFPPKYKPADYCKDCHADNWKLIHDSLYAAIGCQNCHGPAGDHPDNPPKLEINRSRELCLRCHSQLPSATSARSNIQGIDPARHRPGLACANCHNPHHPNPGGKP